MGPLFNEGPLHGDNMPKTYVTFGQDHAHAVNGKTFDKDCVAIIKCENRNDGRAKAFEYFDIKFCFEYHEDEFQMESMKYFPRGLMEVN